MTDGCPGAGRCHGCAVWCPWCDDVTNVCDFDECDVHLRPNELKDAESHLVSNILSRREELRVMEREVHQFRERLHRALSAGPRLKPRPPGWRSK